MKNKVSYIFSKTKWFLLVHTLVIFIAMRVYEKIYPNDNDSYSIFGFLFILIPGLVVAFIFKRIIKKKIDEDKTYKTRTPTNLP